MKSSMRGLWHILQLVFAGLAFWWAVAILDFCCIGGQTMISDIKTNPSFFVLGIMLGLLGLYTFYSVISGIKKDMKKLPASSSAVASVSENNPVIKS